MEILNPLGDGISKLELVRTGGSDVDVVNAARVSYGMRVESMTERDEKLLRYLLKHHHTSPFEHTQLVYRVKCPIYIQREWFRSRIGVSYNEISGRYAKIPLDFYTPLSWRTQDPNNKQSSVATTFENKSDIEKDYKKLCRAAAKTYMNLLDQGVCRELARGVLPLCIYTEFIFTCNLVSLFHFVKLRADKGAQWEIQQYAKGLLKLARDAFPVSISSWEKLNDLEVAYEKAQETMMDIKPAIQDGKIKKVDRHKTK